MKSEKKILNIGVIYDKLSNLAGYKPMTPKLGIVLSIFWGMQVVAQIFFKWGSQTQSNWVGGFILGNCFGFSSIWFLMILYREMNAPMALALGTSGSFILGQVALAIFFGGSISISLALGVVITVLGIVIISFGN